MSENDWTAKRDELARRIGELRDGAFVALRHPFPVPSEEGEAASGGFLSRLRRPRVEAPESYAQFLHMGDEVRGEVHLDGPVDLAVGEARLAADGWTAPADQPAHDRCENWVRFSDPRDSTATAAGGVAALEAAGLDPGSDAWEWSEP